MDLLKSPLAPLLSIPYPQVPTLTNRLKKQKVAKQSWCRNVFQ